MFLNILLTFWLLSTEAEININFNIKENLISTNNMWVVRLHEYFQCNQTSNNNNYTCSQYMKTSYLTTISRMFILDPNIEYFSNTQDLESETN